MSISLKIVTPNMTAYDHDVTEVQFPGFEGQMGILEGHAQLLTLSKPGVVTIEGPNGTERFLIGKGFAEITSTELSLLVDVFEDIAAIDKDKAKSDLLDAEEALSRTSPSNKDYSFIADRVALSQARVEA
jgi:F-type H+-transporting ATPase subunit epsilon